MSDVWASWKDCKKILMDGKSVDRFWVVFEKYFWWEKAEERWLIRKASVTDSCLILDTLAASCNIHWADSILCSICKVFLKYLCCFSNACIAVLLLGPGRDERFTFYFRQKQRSLDPLNPSLPPLRMMMLNETLVWIKFNLGLSNVSKCGSLKWNIKSIIYAIHCLTVSYVYPVKTVAPPTDPHCISILASWHLQYLLSLKI